MENTIVLVNPVASLYHNSSSFYIVQCIKFTLYIGIFAIMLLLLHTLAMEKTLHKTLHRHCTSRLPHGKIHGGT